MALGPEHRKELKVVNTITAQRIASAAEFEGLFLPGRSSVTGKTPWEQYDSLVQQGVILNFNGFSIHLSPTHSRNYGAYPTWMLTVTALTGWEFEEGMELYVLRGLTGTPLVRHPVAPPRYSVQFEIMRMDDEDIFLCEGPVPEELQVRKTATVQR